MPDDPPSDNSTPEVHADWSNLVVRAVDDISHILQSEIHLFESSLRGALESQISNAITMLTMVAVMTSGVVCLIAGLVLFLHQWVRWWGAFSLTGLVVFAIGLSISTLVVKPKPASEEK